MHACLPKLPNFCYKTLISRRHIFICLLELYVFRKKFESFGETLDFGRAPTPVFLWLAKHSHIRHLLEFALASQKSTGVLYHPKLGPSRNFTKNIERNKKKNLN
ncbi:MAG: hypothetical protein UW27_C0002G0033 [Parcubacteria group bacterium GW2011_GWA1_44_13]|uniref:Uncharacterized protein n=1 Tax=Candidatus Nomurabacteria bacterium GW2011_GWB1_44_12 TaxID=1618748 RepID=A0A837I7I8_9BACT|nr:MAG: hypothetical protein UW25_C0002G0034 [Candidatus Nomurabacteria bacterium GW2011_GWB1_44_12]KKT38383.1 MAG: hypothetical protein UW27_C0002G0033 [Parcubacteria group bacterium GW2011_GWA1_44_13]HBB44427.1 hypothetical protein [Candidatus Yonathbacteria bacterium]